MRQTEKLVFLLVLFAGILVVVNPFGKGGDEGASDPLAAAREKLAGNSVPTLPEVSADTASRPAPLPELGTEGGAGTPGASRPQAPSRDSSSGASPLAGSADSARPSYLLDAGSEQPRKAPEPGGPPRILRETRGLRPTASSDYMLYRVQEADTWSALAQRFYRDGRYMRNLRLANEGLVRLKPGRAILVPVFDQLAAVGDRAPLRPAPGQVTGGSAPAATPGAVPPALPAVHEVRKGDSLSGIAKAYYGKASLWPVIFEANRDRLESADWLEVGMELRIPAVDPDQPSPDRSRARGRDDTRPRVH